MAECPFTSVMLATYTDPRHEMEKKEYGMPLSGEEYINGCVV